MDNLSLEQLKTVPWNGKFLPNGTYPPEPPVEYVKNFCRISFMNRDLKYSLFYTWYEIIKLVNSGESKKILDTACGRGQISQVLNLSGHRISACDIEDIFGADESVEFIKTDLNEIFPYQDNEFDYVINSTSLHYLNDSRHFFSECKRILKKGGFAIFSMPNIQAIGNRLYFLKTGKFSEYSNGTLFRRNFLYPDYIFELISDLGFRVEDVRGNVPIKSVKIKIANLLLNKYFFKERDIYKNFSSTLIIKASIN